MCVCAKTQEHRPSPRAHTAASAHTQRRFQKRRAASLRTCRCIMSLITSRPAAPLKAGSRAGRLLVEPPTLASCPPHPTGGGWPLIDTLPSSGYRLDDDLGHKSRRTREKKNESGRDLLSSKMGGDEFCFKRFFFALFLVIPPVIFRRRTPVAVIITMRPALVVLLPLVAAVQPQGPRLGLESFAKLFPTPAATAKPPVAASRRPATKRLTSTRPVAAPASPLSRLFAFNTRSTPPPIAVPTRAKGFQFGTAAPPVRLGLETLGPQRLLATLLVAAALGNAPTLENTPTLTTRTPYSVSSMMPTNDARFEAAMERQRARLVVAEESMRKYEQQVTAAKLKAEKAAESRAASREERLQRTIAQTPRVMEQQEIFPDSKRHSPADDTVAVDDAVVASELVAEVAPEVNVPKVMTQPMVDPLPNKVPAEALRPTQPGTSPTQAAATVLALGTVGIGGALLQARKNADGERTLGTLDAPFTTKTMMTPPENILGTVAARVSKPPPPRAPASTPPSGNVVRRAAAASSAEAAAQAAVEEIGDALKRAVEEARDRAARAEEEAVEGARSALEQKRREELLAEARAAEAERARAAEAALFEAVAEAQAAADALKAEEARIARARANAAATRNAKGAYLANADEKAQRLDGVKAGGLLASLLQDESELSLLKPANGRTHGEITLKNGRDVAFVAEAHDEGSILVLRDLTDSESEDD